MRLCFPLFKKLLAFRSRRFFGSVLVRNVDIQEHFHLLGGNVNVQVVGTGELIFTIFRVPTHHLAEIARRELGVENGEVHTILRELFQIPLDKINTVFALEFLCHLLSVGQGFDVEKGQRFHLAFLSLRTLERIHTNVQVFGMCGNHLDNGFHHIRIHDAVENHLQIVLIRLNLLRGIHLAVNRITTHLKMLHGNYPVGKRLTELGRVLMDTKGCVEGRDANVEDGHFVPILGKNRMHTVFAFKTGTFLAFMRPETVTTFRPERNLDSFKHLFVGHHEIEHHLNIFRASFHVEVLQSHLHLAGETSHRTLTLELSLVGELNRGAEQIDVNLFVLILSHDSENTVFPLNLFLTFIPDTKERATLGADCEACVGHKLLHCFDTEESVQLFQDIRGKGDLGVFGSLPQLEAKVGSLFRGRLGSFSSGFGRTDSEILAKQCQHCFLQIGAVGLLSGVGGHVVVVHTLPPVLFLRSTTVNEKP